MGILIMPKQTSEFERFIITLDILNSAHQNKQKFVTNSDYKKEMIARVDSFSDKSDQSMLVKQSELVRYFGFAIGNFKQRTIHISQTGIEFYEAYKNKNKDKQFELIVNAIKFQSFGRNNTAIQSSDSNIDPPKLFVKSILALDGVTTTELMSLLYLTHDLSLTFESAIEQIRFSRQRYTDIDISDANKNKYKDCKFIPFLTEIDFCIKDDDKRYFLSKKIYDLYANDFKNMSIYNCQPETTIDLLDDTSLITDVSDDDLSDTYKTKVSNTLSYDINSTAFKNQNLRIPHKLDKSNKTEKYSTNVRIAKTALELANHMCENNNTHTTFISKSSVQFMEPHHLIPMSAQKDFIQNLDCIENIVSLCPNCHSAIHYGNDDVRKEILYKLFLSRKSYLNKNGIIITFEELFAKYYK